MSVNWVDGLDMLAQNGVLGYDAASYVKGTPPRYAVNPAGISTPAAVPYVQNGVPYINPNAIATDEFNRALPTREKEVRNPLWKRILWGTLIVITGGVAAKWLIKGSAKTIKKAVTSTKYQTGMQNLRAGLKRNWNAIKNFFKHPVANTKAGIKKHPKLYKFCLGVKNFFKHPIKSIKNLFKAKP